MAKITGADLVHTFQQYEYVRYTWGGASPDTGWDCSGACNWICGWKYHLAIPNYGPGDWGPGLGHGPVVADWIQWIGVDKTVYGPTKPAPGDLIAWGPNVHIGMAINSTRFVSAANQTDGTIEANIDGFFTYAPYVLRILQVLIGPTLVGIPKPPGPGRDDYSSKIRHTASFHLRTAQYLNDGTRALRNIR